MNRPTLAPEVHASLAARWQPLVRSRLHYHVSWSTRGRRPLFKDRHVNAIESMVQAICDERGYGLDQVAVGADHVHVLVALRATQSIASVVRELKGRIAPALLAEHPELRVWLRGNLVWDESFAVQTVSAARIERVRSRLKALHGVDESLARAS
jgi:putative transposase